MGHWGCITCSTSLVALSLLGCPPPPQPCNVDADCDGVLYACDVAHAFGDARGTCQLAPLSSRSAAASAASSSSTAASSSSGGANCESACVGGTCVQGTCTFDCSTDSACAAAINCPAG